MKTCNKCKTAKPLEEFRKSCTKKDGRRYTCKSCCKAYEKIKFQDPEYRAKRYLSRKKWRVKLKKIGESRKSLGCLTCDEKEICCLDFHHKDPKLKKLCLSQFSKFTSLQQFIDELDKCIVLCSNCHRKLHAGLISLDL